MVSTLCYYSDILDAGRVGRLSYRAGRHANRVSEKLKNFWFSMYPDGQGSDTVPNNTPLPLLFMVDEARSLCETDAWDGSKITDKADQEDKAGQVGKNGSTKENAESVPEVLVPAAEDRAPLPHRQFSNFRAFRRALRYLSTETSFSHDESLKGHIFALVTDTSSRIANFQPPVWNDDSARLPDLPKAGFLQFPPIYTFSSIDVYARTFNVTCLSDPKEVAKTERLVKFGRAGWYSIFYHAPRVLKDKSVKPDTDLHRLAKVKLLGPAGDSGSWSGSRKGLLRDFACLAPRLAVTIGPYNIEAAEAIASHLAVLVGTDNDRHCLKCMYPSEPILSQVSAQYTREIGWSKPLQALKHYVMTGIVDAGFPGELLTKLTCLLAMDTIHLTTAPAEGYGKFTRAVRVRDFLDALISPVGTDNTAARITISEMLTRLTSSEGVDRRALNVDHKKLETFLNGWVFFNHFIRIEVDLTMPILVHAWNRGAAIECKTGTQGVDYVIPVILTDEMDKDVTFGPLFGDWTVENFKAARRHVSWIAINSKDYAKGKDQVDAAKDTKLSEKNFRRSADIVRQQQASREQGNVDQLILQAVQEPEDDDVEEDTEDADKAYGYWLSQDNERHPVQLEMDVVADDVPMPDVVDDELDQMSITDNVYLSLLQDFGPKLKRESFVSFGDLVPCAYRIPRAAQPALKTQTEERTNQVVIILKGIGPSTYHFLRDDRFATELSNNDIIAKYLSELPIVKHYLSELSRVRLPYIDDHRRLMKSIADGGPSEKSITGLLEELTLVYGTVAWSWPRWNSVIETYRSQLEAELPK
jgi:hypothetical protein